MLILALRAFFVSSLFSFLGTHGRTLPEDIWKMSSKNNHGWTSMFDVVRRTPKPPPHVDPPFRPGCLKSISHVTGNAQHIAPPEHSLHSYVTYDKIMKMRRSIGRPHHAPPPPPHIAPRPRSSYDASLAHSKITNTYCGTGSLCSRIVKSVADI